MPGTYAAGHFPLCPCFLLISLPPTSKNKGKKPQRKKVVSLNRGCFISFQYGVCIFSLCLCQYPPGAPVTSHHQNRLILLLVALNQSTSKRTAVDPQVLHYGYPLLLLFVYIGCRGSIFLRWPIKYFLFYFFQE